MLIWGGTVHIYTIIFPFCIVFVFVGFIFI